MLSSVLFQLCSQSNKFSQVISSIYSSHGDGSREPSIVTLLECLKTILALQGQAPIYIVMDALDECPSSSGIPTQRQEVLEIVKELVGLKLPHLHFCVTSRPEIDIRRVFDPLNPYNLSLHNQGGQLRDLAEYIKSVVDSDATMQDWPSEVKELVINTLTEKGGGMYVIKILTSCILFSCDAFRFRWAYCQLETLRQCPRRHISSTLEKLPKTLDETYERILQGIPELMQSDAHRIFQCLTVSLRPLGVEELAEVFVINFEEETSGIPIFEPSWRDANAETAVLSACSTLVTIVVEPEWPHGKIVRFSHFSVQEYLTSDRIANAEHVSRFYIHPKPAHILLAKACLSVLLHLDYNIDEAKIKDFPLAKYAAMHWVEHAEFEDVSSYIGDGMDILFDKDKPHFATWVWLSDIDFDGPRPENLVPLYYAALCGLDGLVERLLTAHPQDLDAKGGGHGAPLNAALAGGHLNIAQFLLDHGAVGDTIGFEGQTGLFIASSLGYADIVRSLINHDANLNVRCKDYDMEFHEVWWTPLHAAIYDNHLDMVHLLLEGGADPEARNSEDQTGLFMASSRGHADAVRLLIDGGADLNAKSRDWTEYGIEVEWTPLHAAIYKERQDIVLLLLERGSDPEIRSSQDETALYVASSCKCANIVPHLISHGADPSAECEFLHSTPLHVASRHGSLEITRMLLEHGANPNAMNYSGGTALHVVSKITVVGLLLEYGVNVDVRDKERWTPLHKAAFNLNLQVLEVLLDRGADPHALTNDGKTPLQLADVPYYWASKKDQAQIIQLLSERTGERIQGSPSRD